MLSPETRTVAFELLCPPAGHDLDFALLTTYTLDLEAMLALPLSVLARADKGIEDLLADPLLLLEALRRTGDQIHVFVDRMGIAIPQSRRELYAALEPSLHPVKAPGNGAFHPKVWLLRFLTKDRPPLLRIAVLSRNLTFDRSWDVALVSEGSPKPKRRSSASQQLASFIRRLPDLAAEHNPNSLKPNIVDRIRNLADEVSRTSFPAPDGFDDKPIKFHVRGLSHSRLPWHPISDAQRTLAIAPFVNRVALGAIAKIGEGERILVSSQESLDKLHEESLEQWNPVFTLNVATEIEPEDGISHRLSGLHAKILSFERGWNVTWYVGSANLTAAALKGKNVEVMASITARKGRAGGKTGQGIDRFFESGFRELCAPYQRGEGQTDEPDVVEAHKRLEKSRDILLQADLRVTCLPLVDDWILRLEGTVELLPDDVTVTVWPISITEEQAQSLNLPLNWTLPVQRLTCLVAFRLHVPMKDVEDITFALRLPIAGLPPDRLHHVLRSLIGDTERFLAFLRALLGGFDGLAEPLHGEGSNEGGIWMFGMDDETLLEDLVRTASRDPERLEPVRSLIESILETDEGNQIVPTSFLNIWDAVNEALRDQNSP